MATLTPSYSAYGTVTISPASLASSADFTAGRESDAINNSTDLYDDVLVSGYITVGTTPTANTVINVYVYAQFDDTPTYLDVLDGTDSAETITNSGVLQSGLRLLVSLPVTATTSNVAQPFAPTSVAALFNGVVPKRWGLFVAHNTGVALNSTAGNHVIKYQGIKWDIA